MTTQHTKNEKSFPTYLKKYEKVCIGLVKNLILKQMAKEC